MTDETIRTIINSGYLTLALVLVALAIITYPTLANRAKKSRR